MAQYYASLIDQFIYFPVNIIPLKADNMRIADTNYQLEVDKNILKTLDMFDIGGDRIHYLKSVSIADRTKEILNVLQIDDALEPFAQQFIYVPSLVQPSFTPETT
jgi:hypothetical protein